MYSILAPSVFLQLEYDLTVTWHSVGLVSAQFGSVSGSDPFGHSV